MKADSGNTQLTFWDHLDELRGVLVRCIILLVLLTLVAFCFREELFGIVLAPKNPDFCIYGLFCRIAEWIQLPSLCPDTFYVRLINTELAGQFLTHMSVAFMQDCCWLLLIYYTSFSALSLRHCTRMSGSIPCAL